MAETLDGSHSAAGPATGRRITRVGRTHERVKPLGARAEDLHLTALRVHEGKTASIRIRQQSIVRTAVVDTSPIRLQRLLDFGFDIQALESARRGQLPKHFAAIRRGCHHRLFVSVAMQFEQFRHQLQEKK